MKVIFFGTPDFAIPTLQALLKHPEFTVLGVVSQPDKPRGRGKEVSPSPVKRLALEHNLTVWQPARIKKDAATLNLLREAEADVFVVVAYGQILSPEILAMPRMGCINVHGSILPKYRGAAPIQWCLYYGEKTTGITTMLMDKGMDTGPMLLKSYLPINLLDNCEQLAEKLAQEGANLLINTLLKIKDTGIEAIAQDNTEATYAPMIKKEDFLLNWSRNALDLHNQIRGFYPYCTTQFRGQVLKVLATVPLDDEIPSPLESLAKLADSLSELKGEPGEIVKILKNWGPVIQTGQGLLLLKTLQLSGKRQQSGWDFANGTRLQPGEKLL